LLLSTLVYLRLLIAVVGLISLVKPMRVVRLPTRARAFIVTISALALVAALLLLPSRQHHIDQPVMHLDQFTPVWQFSEYHALDVPAPPAAVFEAIKRVRPDEVFLFQTLIRIRNCGKLPPANVVEASKRFESLIDIATHSTFVCLADDPPRELVVGTVVGWPSGRQEPITTEMFQKPLPPGFALATMNYLVRPNGRGGSVVSTETRVFANSPSARRRFAVYWRVIYPGSATIRRMFLRAVGRHAANNK